MRIAIASYHDEIEELGTEEKKCISVEKSWLSKVLTIPIKTICVFPVVGANYTTSDNEVIVVDADSPEEVIERIERLARHSPLRLYHTSLENIAEFIARREINDINEAVMIVAELFRRLDIRVKKWIAVYLTWLEISDIVSIALSMDEDDKILHIKNDVQAIFLFDNEDNAIIAELTLRYIEGLMQLERALSDLVSTLESTLDKSSLDEPMTE